jgi:hypothetical protein
MSYVYYMVFGKLLKENYLIFLSVCCSYLINDTVWMYTIMMIGLIFDV